MFKVRYMLSFMDMLFIMLLLFLSLFALSIINPKDDESKKTLIEKAEFIVTIEWQDDNPDDVDLYLQDPEGNLVWFSQKSAGLLHLERDDRGLAGDKIVLPDGSVIEFSENSEKVAIRGIIPGEYCFNIHMFAKNSSVPAKVKCKVEKVNPFSIVYFKEIPLSRRGEETTVCRFSVSNSGKILDINDLKKSLVSNQ